LETIKRSSQFNSLLCITEQHFVIRVSYQRYNKTELEFLGNKTTCCCGGAVCGNASSLNTRPLLHKQIEFALAGHRLEAANAKRSPRCALRSASAVRSTAVLSRPRAKKRPTESDRSVGEKAGRQASLARSAWIWPSRSSSFCYSRRVWPWYSLFFCLYVFAIRCAARRYVVCVLWAHADRSTRSCLWVLSSLSLSCSLGLFPSPLLAHSAVCIAFGLICVRLAPRRTRNDDNCLISCIIIA
jgi:hypothetical protein